MSNIEVKLPTIKCPFNCIDESTGEVFEWVPRVKNPVKCPNCSRKLARANRTIASTLVKKKEESTSVQVNGRTSDIGVSEAPPSSISSPSGPNTPENDLEEVNY